MLNKYHNEAFEVSDRLQVLYARKDKFSKHATLYTRVAGVCLEISELEKQLDELYS